MTSVTVLFFGELAEIAGTKSTTLSDLHDTIALKDYIHLNYPRLNDKTFTMALNKELVTEKQLLKNGDEIALLPPYAGG